MHWTIQSLHHKHVLIYHITCKRPISFALVINNYMQLSQSAESQPRKKFSKHSRSYLVTSSRGIEKRNANTTIVIGQVVGKRYTSTTELKPTQTQIPFVKDKLVWRNQACKQLIAIFVEASTSQLWCCSADKLSQLRTGERNRTAACPFTCLSPHSNIRSHGVCSLSCMRALW